MTGALDGLRVLDLTRYLPGPYCTMLLGDLGADVVKIEEPPIGDPTRGIPPEVGEDSAVHAALNRNKRSVLVDLRSDEGAAVVKELARRTDVLVETHRPGVLARRGLGAAFRVGSGLDVRNFRTCFQLGAILGNRLIGDPQVIGQVRIRHPNAVWMPQSPLDGIGLIRT